MKKVLSIYYILAAIIFAGFATHGSDNPEIYIFSKKYFAVLVVMALAFFLAIPWWVNSFVKKNGTRDFLMALVPSLIMLFIVYLGGHYYYYATQEHLFDPFLQMPPNEYEFSSEKDSSTFRVLCLGGSTTMNTRLDTIDRYPSQLHQILNKKFPHRKVEVLNAGMDWYTSKHTNINYTLYTRDFKPDVVVVMHGINDLCRSFSPESLAVGDYKNDYSHFYGPSIAGAKPPSFESLIRALFRKFWFTPSFDPASFDISAFKSLEDFPKYMSTIVELLKNDGAEVILVSQPYLYKSKMSAAEEKELWMDRSICIVNGKYPDRETMALAMDAYNMKTAAISSKYKTTFVHGEPALPKDLEHFVDDVHYTPLGAKKLAEAIANKITVKD
jgi:lysophospholipase L1-like esterase